MICRQDLPSLSPGPALDAECPWQIPIKPVTALLPRNSVLTERREDPNDPALASTPPGSARQSRACLMPWLRAPWGLVFFFFFSAGIAFPQLLSAEIFSSLTPDSPLPSPLFPSPAGAALEMPLESLMAGQEVSRSLNRVKNIPLPARGSRGTTLSCCSTEYLKNACFLSSK